jgi:cysteine-rich secretory family protein
MRRTVGALVAALLVAGAMLGLSSAHATSWSSASYASRLVELVNQARQKHGLGTLSVASGTSQVAASWTAHLDAAQSLSHNPDLRHQLETHGSPDWTTYGENVGEGPADNPDALFDAYMNSSEHRANILNGGYRFTGVAVVLDGDTAWNTFDFVDTYHQPKQTSSPQVKPKPKPSAATPRPAPVTTPHSTTPTSDATTPAAVMLPPPATRTATSPAAAEVQATHRALPHTGTRRHAGAVPDLARLLGGPSASGPRSGALVLAAAVRPLHPALPASSDLAIAIAGLLLGFVGVRWWHVARAA